MSLLRHLTQSLKARIALAMLAVFVGGLWSLAWYASGSLRADMARLLGERQYSTVRLVAADIDHEVVDRVAGLQEIAARAAAPLRQGPAALQDFLEQRPLLLTLFSGGVIGYDAAGTALADVPATSGRRGVNYSDIDVVAAALRHGRSTVGRPVVGKKLGVPVFGFGVPVRDADGRVIGALAGVVNLGLPNFLDRITHNTYGVGGGYQLIAPQHRLIVTASDKAEVMQALPASGASPAVDRMAAGFEGHMVFVDTKGVEQLAAYQRIRSTGWTLALTLPTAEAFAPIRALQQRMLQATAALTLLAAALAWWMLQRQFAPMSDAVARLDRRRAAGDELQPLPVALPDELGRLITSFNQTLQALGEKDAALRDSEARLRGITDNAPAVIFVKDLAGHYLHVNRRFEALFHVSRESMLGRTDYDVFARERADAFVANDRRSAESGRAIEIEELVPQDDGMHTYLAVKFPLFDRAGAVVAVCGIATDITERKRAEQRLRASEAQIKGILEGAADAIFIVDRAGRYQYANAQALRLVDYDLAALLERQVHDLTPPEDRATVGAQFQELLRSGALLTELTLLRRDGRRVPVELNGRLLPDGNVFGSCRDITERKLIERELTQYRDHLEDLVAQRTHELAHAKEAAEAASIAKSAFLANMSHEIRTPLHAITGMAYLIREAGVSAEQAARLDRLEAAGTHLLEILNAILDLSKIEAGKFTLDDAPLRVDAVLGNVVSMLAEPARAKGLALQVQAAALPDGLWGDATRLQQALLNYASNAVKFTERGSVWLRAAVVDEDAAGALLRFEVEDTGAGIDPATLPRLFAPFEQADSSTTRAHGGTGLGLAITRRLAALMGGQAGAHSRPGAGSTFWFTARLRKAAGAVADAPPVVQRPRDTIARAHAGRQVLLVEDEPVNQEIVRTVLQQAGLRVSVAEDGEAGVAMAAGGDFALVLMDMQMPRLDGVEATRRLRAQGLRMPIVAMTANAFADDRARCQAAGMDGFLAKPVRPAELYTELLRWLDAAPAARLNGPRSSPA